MHEPGAIIDSITALTRWPAARSAWTIRRTGCDENPTLQPRTLLRAIHPEIGTITLSIRAHARRVTATTEDPTKRAAAETTASVPSLPCHDDRLPLPICDPIPACDSRPGTGH
jgi:hypothetical protein